mgnify:CR=1 FL=1
MPPLRWALGVCLLTFHASAQSTDSQPKAEARPTRADTHIMGMLPNYKTVPDMNTPVPPMTVRDKFRLARLDAFDPMAFVVSGLYAGIGQAVRQNEEWGLGAKGFGKRYGAAVADQVQSSYFQDAIMPALFRQDPRYYRMAHGNTKTRMWYAVSRTFVTRSDSGHTQINASEFAGNAAQFALSAFYYPAEARNAKDVSTKYIVQFGVDAFFNIVKEYWPDVNRKLFKKH